LNPGPGRHPSNPFQSIVEGENRLGSVGATRRESVFKRAQAARQACACGRRLPAPRGPNPEISLRDAPRDALRPQTIGLTSARDRVAVRILAKSSGGRRPSHWPKCAPRPDRRPTRGRSIITTW